jgi:hypothetical protein
MAEDTNAQELSALQARQKSDVDAAPPSRDYPSTTEAKALRAAMGYPPLDN